MRDGGVGRGAPSEPASSRSTRTKQFGPLPSRTPVLTFRLHAHLYDASGVFIIGYSSVLGFLAYVDRR